MRVFLLLIFFLPFTTLAQPTSQPSAAEIELKMKKLGFLGSVLYMAAHPDDENTNIIAYLSNERLATTAYLSLTRGDGGQNLIGPEIRDRLGLIRTQELLAARRIDGGQQFFTRAIDFGFSKSPEEAFSIWGRDAVLSDATRILRQFQPDIIIRRFPPTSAAGHGHHTASAIVAEEVMELAAKSDQYPEQVKQFGTWQVKRLYTNTGRWWNQTVTEDTPGVITIDVGGYSPLLGRSYTEISALSSSQHKSQGWGRRGVRGHRPEFLEHIKGEPADKDIFDGIDTSWKRVRGGESVEPLVNRVINEFNPQDPAASVPLLLQIRKAIKGLEKNVWTTRKLQETEELIIDCLGLFIETTANQFQVAPGEPVSVSIEMLNRAKGSVKVLRMSSKTLDWDSAAVVSLASNNPKVVSVKARVQPDVDYSDPYWLRSSHSTGLYTVKDPAIIGTPENRPVAEFDFELDINGETITVTRPLIYKWVDPVKGELWRPFEVVPPVYVNLSQDVLVFSSEEAKQLTLLVRSASDRPMEASVKLVVPQGWRVDPPTASIKLAERGAEQRVVMNVRPSSKEVTGEIKAIVSVNGRDYDRSLHLIAYDHFPIQTLLPPASAKAVRINLKKAGETIGYIRGAGDDIPAALRNMGYRVVELNDEDITSKNLESFDAVVLGVRALNTNDRARYFMPAVLDYVKNGGTVVVQYNTNANLQTSQFSPFPLEIGRERVTDETASVKILKPNHEVVTTPNKITAEDFEGWVQERGLYFPAKWDENFETILSMSDPQENAKESSLLVARYGQGYYVYTGLSFFRQLPEGVPGAYKLFANLVSIGKSSRAKKTK